MELIAGVFNPAGKQQRRSTRESTRSLSRAAREFRRLRGRCRSGHWSAGSASKDVSLVATSRIRRPAHGWGELYLAQAATRLHCSGHERERARARFRLNLPH